MTAMFDGVRVIEVAQMVFVPAAGAVLCDLGADVIKIEPPETGDAYRGLHTAIYAESEVNLNSPTPTGASAASA